MAASKIVLVIGFKSGDEEVLKASLSAWTKHFAKCEMVVIGDKCTLPKEVMHIEFAGIPNDMVKAAAEKIEAESFVFAYDVFPLKKVTIADIDKPYCNLNGDFNTRLPRLYDKAKVLTTTPILRVSFEHVYFANKYKNVVPVALHDLSDGIRLQVLSLTPDSYRTKHLLKYNKFLVTNKNGLKAVNLLS